MSFEIKAYGALQAEVDSTIVPLTIKRRAVGPNDVHIKITSASICHSDIHHIRQEWGPAPGKQVVGHEMVGNIVAIGENVKTHKVGDFVGVGCMVGAKCTENGTRHCSSCVNEKDERYCEKGNIGTYGTPDEIDGEKCVTWGGYSTDIVVDAHFACPVPDFYTGENLKYASPILCAGITTYTPLKRFGAGPGKTVGVNGVGGLGMYCVMIARAMGAEVYAFTRSQSKVADLEALGCKVIVSTDEEQMKAARGTLDLIIDTVSADHDINSLIATTKVKGTYCVVGGSPEPLKLAAFSLIFGDRVAAGSMIGTIEDTCEVLKLCAEHKICVPVEVIKPDQINEAYTRVMKSDVKYRFSIDIESMRQ